MQDINDLKSNINHLKVYYTGRLEHQIIAKVMNYIDLSELNITLVYESFIGAERKPVFRVSHHNFLEVAF